MKARIGDIDVHYEVAGQGPWVTLSNPVATDLHLWDGQMAALTPHFTVLRYDTRGHGRTQSSTGPYTLAQLAADARGLLRHLGITQTHWVGESLGGMVGQALALADADVLDRVVLANTTSEAAANAESLWGERARVAREQGMQAVVVPTLSRWFTEPFRVSQPELMLQMAAMIEATSVDGFAGCCAALGQVHLSRSLHQLRLPALVLAGGRDQATPVTMAQQLAEHWPGAALVVLPEAAHISNVECADAFNSAVLGFLRG